jgi:phage/conjugal plasmid C-4 type zinc finger TraR family protein
VDEIDHAQALEEYQREQALKNARLKPRRDESPTHCVDCGEAIPEPRRLALQPDLCVECQEDHERRYRLLR